MGRYVKRYMITYRNQSPGLRGAYGSRLHGENNGESKGSENGTGNTRMMWECRV